MVDTHTHLYMQDYDGGAEAAIKRALDAGVGRLIFPCVDLPSANAMKSLNLSGNSAIGIGLGIHPTELGDDWREHLSQVREILKGQEIVAIGEIGLDYHWDASRKEEQKEAFLYQMQLAWELGLPVIIHSRDALDDTLEVIVKLKKWIEHKAESGVTDDMPTLIFHSFTGSPDDVDKIREVCDPYFGINGVVTFKNSGALPDAVRRIGIDRILLETDSPYLAPVPRRGRRNESAYLPYILNKIAEILGLSVEECEEITDRNASYVFRRGVIVE